MTKLKNILDLIESSLTNHEIDELKEILQKRKDKFFFRGKGNSLIASDPCKMLNGQGNALIVGKVYKPTKTDKYGIFKIKSEIDNEHSFDINSIREI